jgi:tRNA A-37 threonylcarbamoyl transferase component Bud32
VPAAGSDSGGRRVGGRYRLGAGARGEVWSGTDEVLDRPVAIKQVRLPLGLADREAAELRERALREARAIAAISHPNVVTLHDVVREDDEPFVVMELLPGPGLAELLRRGPLPEDRLAAVADAVAAALQAAHRAGIVHRDVKPGNVLLGASGQVKLGDFGISRNAAEPSLTGSGIVLGTPAFVAPEIAAGEEVTGAADLWGLGATLFAASEGRPPYGESGDPVATVTEVVRGPVPEPSRETALSGVIRGLMVKDPAARMPLEEVRQQAAPLFAGTRPFEEELPAPETAPASAPAPREDPAPVPLASDPGPLPFAPEEPPKRRWSAVVLRAAAVGVFTAACAGGFAAGRALMGPAPPQPPHLPPMVQLADSADHFHDGSSAQFSLAAPEGWTVFHEERDELTNSLVVHDVSPSGSEEIAVERFGDFFGKGCSTAEYLAQLPRSAAGSPAQFHERASRAVGPGGEGRSDLELSYDADSPPRRTFARVLRRDQDLWVVRVTVRADDADRGRQLFDAVAPTFAPRPG